MKFILLFFFEFNNSYDIYIKFHFDSYKVNYSLGERILTSLQKIYYLYISFALITFVYAFKLNSIMLC